MVIVLLEIVCSRAFSHSSNSAGKWICHCLQLLYSGRMLIRKSSLKPVFYISSVIHIMTGLLSPRGEASTVSPFSSHTAWDSVWLLSSLRKFYRANRDLYVLLFRCLVTAKLTKPSLQSQTAENNRTRRTDIRSLHA